MGLLEVINKNIAEMYPEIIDIEFDDIEYTVADKIIPAEETAIEATKTMAEAINEKSMSCIHSCCVECTDNDIRYGTNPLMNPSEYSAPAPTPYKGE